MTDRPSLAARVHAHLGALPSWSGIMSIEEQADLFGVPLSDSSSEIGIRRDEFGTLVVAVDGAHYSSKDIQARAEDFRYPYSGWDDDEFCYDFYRSFPRDESAVVCIENAETGFYDELFGTNLDEARNNFARYYGYAGWDEMTSLLPAPGAWTAVWTNGDPEESRKRSIEQLTAERKDLVGKFDAAERLKEVDYLLDMYTAKDRHVFKDGSPYCAAIQHWRLIDGKYYTGRIDLVDVMDKAEAEALVAERAGDGISIRFDPQSDDVTDEGDVPLHGTTLTWYPRALIEEAFQARDMGAYH